jgi:hypothetical protein
MFQSVACIWKLLYLAQTSAHTKECEQEIPKKAMIGDREQDDNDRKEFL